jgi:hypothetical protein
MDDVRFHLVRWIVERHLPFTAIEDKNFRLMLEALNPTVASSIVKSGDSIRNWIEDEFLQAKAIIISEILSTAISKIHISCDLWSSPNGYAICGVVAHFIGHQQRCQQVLLAMKRMRYAHSGEQIGLTVLEVLKDYSISKDRLGVFIADNAESNDVAWRHLLSEFDPQKDATASRSRCLGHIINLAAKAFIFGSDIEAFEGTVDAVDDMTPLDSDVMRQAQDAWRKKGPIGKVHNVIVFIRSSPQRKEAFKRTITEGATDVSEGTSSSFLFYHFDFTFHSLGRNLKRFDIIPGL